MDDKDIATGLDGNQYFAHRRDFINLQESLAGFGDTPEEAIEDLKKQEE